MKSSYRWSCSNSPRYPPFSQKVKMITSMFGKSLVLDDVGIVDKVAEAEPPEEQVPTHFKSTPAMKSRVPGSRVVRVQVAMV